MATSKEIIRELILGAVSDLGLESEAVLVTPTSEGDFGDYTSNMALVLASKIGKNPKDLAEEILAKLIKAGGNILDKIEVAGPGFINFYLSKEYLKDNLAKVLAEGETYGQGSFLANKKVLVEYTDPNPFKVFHIGHLMSNTVGESISRLLQFAGAEIKRACYQGDVGMHVAKTIWALRRKMSVLPEDLSLPAKIAFLGEAYKVGSQSFAVPDLNEEIKEINKKIYDRSDEKINELYDLGRTWSLEYFETIYKKLGTQFDYYFFESETGKFGQELVEEWLGRGVFESSDGAVVFRGEQFGLHTRVFINSEGLPTYEAKELGLVKVKYEKYPYDISVVVTGNEVNDYFKVLLCALKLIFPDLALKTKHIGHGMLRLPTGKMSSRTGDVVSAEDLLFSVREYLAPKMIDRNFDGDEQEEIMDMVAVGALKYSILKQDIGKDIVFDFDKSLSFDGSSGPYLQYTFVRTQSILAKKEKAVDVNIEDMENLDLSLERKIEKFSAVVERAAQDLAPQQVVTYLVELASLYNSYYANWKIVGSESESYRLALTEAVGQVLKNGLWLLGIKTPRKM